MHHFTRRAPLGNGFKIPFMVVSPHVNKEYLFQGARFILKGDRGLPQVEGLYVGIVVHTLHEIAPRFVALHPVAAVEVPVTVHTLLGTAGPARAVVAQLPGARARLLDVASAPRAVHPWSVCVCVCVCVRDSVFILKYPAIYLGSVHYAKFTIKI